MTNLEHGRLFAIDGGVFRVKCIPEQEHIELWTYRGFSGSVIARTGFDTDADGRLYHRVYDLEAQEQILIPSGYTIDDLEEVPDDEMWMPPFTAQEPDDSLDFDDNPW